MTAMYRELGRLSYTLIARGIGMLALGVAAIVWPEPLLIGAMLTVGLMSVLLGLYEISIAVTIRRGTAYWWIALVHGLASLCFGLLSVGAPALSLRLALAVIAGWLLIYAGVVWSGAALLWPARRVRWALVSWGVVDVLLAIVIVAYPAATIFSFLFFGAVYAAVFGAWQLATGVWLRRRLRGRHAMVSGLSLSEGVQGAVAP